MSLPNPIRHAWMSLVWIKMADEIVNEGFESFLADHGFPHLTQEMREVAVEYLSEEPTAAKLIARIAVFDVAGMD